MDEGEGGTASSRQVRATPCTASGIEMAKTTCRGFGSYCGPEYCAAAGKEYDVPQVAEKKRAPKATVGEIARLAHAITDPSLRSATEIIMQGWSSRAELDDKIGRENPWESIAALFNDESFRPTNFYVDRADGFDQVYDIDPSYLPYGERGSLQLQGWFAEKKSKINIYKTHWNGPSGLNASGDHLPRVNFVQGDLGGLYMWEVMEEHNLFGLVRKNLPENVAQSTPIQGAGSSWAMPDPTPPGSRAARYYATCLPAVYFWDVLMTGLLPTRKNKSEPETSASSKEAFLSEMSLYLKDKRQRTTAAAEENQVKLWIQIAENQNLPQALRDSANRKIDRFLGN